MVTLWASTVVLGADPDYLEVDPQGRGHGHAYRVLEAAKATLRTQAQNAGHDPSRVEFRLVKPDTVQGIAQGPYLFSGTIQEDPTP